MKNVMKKSHYQIIIYIIKKICIPSYQSCVLKKRDISILIML